MQEQAEDNFEDARVQHVADVLMEGRREPTGEELPSGLFVTDLEATLRIFTLDFHFLEGLNYFPAFEADDGEPVPISLRALLGRSWQPGPWTQANMFRSTVYERVESLVSASRATDRVPLQRLSHERAFGLVKDRLLDFIRFRLRAVRVLLGANAEVSGDWRAITVSFNRGAGSAATPGCLFKVETRTPGLTVYWSPAFFIAPNFFGAPSSPVTNTLQAGTYRFGVSNQGGPLWDHNAVVNIPQDRAVYLQF